ncbi:DUF6596 domain-containing protein [Streptosporangium lutulentum]
MTNVHRTIDAVWKLESAKIIAGLTRMVHDVGLAEELAQEIQASRSAARIGPSGEPVQLHEQNRGRWDQLLIRRDFLAMLRARELGGTPGLYVLQLDGIRRELGSVHSLQRGAPCVTLAHRIQIAHA